MEAFFAIRWQDYKKVRMDNSGFNYLRWWTLAEQLLWSLAILL